MALVPVLVCLAYIFGLRQGKPPGYDRDIFEYAVQWPRLQSRSPSFLHSSPSMKSEKSHSESNRTSSDKPQFSRLRLNSFRPARHSSSLSPPVVFGESRSGSWNVSSWATIPKQDGKKTSPTDLLILVFETRMVFLYGWRLEQMLDPLMQGRVKRVHAEKFLGTLMIGEPWVSEIVICSPIHNAIPLCMNSDELKAIESQRQALLGQLTVAETALRAGLHTHGFGSTARAHMERALAHIQEAYIAINEMQAGAHRAATGG